MQIMKKKMRCLIVDDDKYFILYLKTLFELNGFDVYSSLNAENAVDIIKKQKVNFVISDIHMPEKDGFYLLQEISKESSTKDIPVIVVSNDDSKDVINRIINMGAAGYIRKPFLKKHISYISDMLIHKGTTS